MGLFKSQDEKIAERLQENISSELMKTKNLVDGFAVAFCNGVATLSGTCDTPKTRKKAMLFAEMAEGVTEVQASQLRISESYVDPSAATEGPAASSARAGTQAAPPGGEPKPEAEAVSQAAQAQSEGRSVQPEEAGNRLYTIQSGDTLSAIAKQFYGDANKYMVIFEANREILKDPNKIYPGQAIRIPPLP